MNVKIEKEGKDFSIFKRLPHAVIIGVNKCGTITLGKLRSPSMEANYKKVNFFRDILELSSKHNFSRRTKIL